MTTTTVPFFGKLFGDKSTSLNTHKVLGKHKKYFYARINEENICTSVWSFDEPVQNKEAVMIDSLDTTLIGKVWENGAWVRV